MGSAEAGESEGVAVVFSAASVRGGVAGVLVCYFYKDGSNYISFSAYFDISIKFELVWLYYYYSIYY